MRSQRKRISPADWLIGTWRSNKERTFAEYPWPKKNGAKLKRILGRDLGKLTFRYSRKRVLYLFKARKWEGRAAYRVVWQNSQDLFIVSGPKHREEGQLIRFFSPREYRVQMGRGFEYFRKVRGT